MSIAIVVVGYRRVDCIVRLLNSLLNAKYEREDVTLIISIDKSDSTAVEDVARDFKWPYGEKRIVAKTENMGLRKHILSCGCYLEEFDAIIVLEEDLIVAEGFYQYAKACVSAYQDDDSIAGISLYSYKINEYNFLPFQPEIDLNSDVYFMQFAASWGQIWLKHQWQEFIKWYEQNTNLDLHDVKEMPGYIADWGKNSWKKYHIAYCVQNKKFFVFPYVSYSNNPGEQGEHYRTNDTKFSVPMGQGIKDDYKLVAFNGVDAIKYDGFFERIIDGELCFDIYGGKTKYDKRYIASTQVLPYKIVGSFGLKIHPHEQNVLSKIDGCEIRLYDSHMKDKRISFKTSYNHRMLYYYRKNPLSVPITVGFVNLFITTNIVIKKQIVGALVSVKHGIEKVFRICMF